MNDLVRDFDKGWTGGLPETKCGYGSTMRATRQQREWIPAQIDKYNIKSIADIGAGDLNWIKKTHLSSDIEYQAYDLVPRQPEIKLFDLVKEIPPAVDMIMCLWVLNHLPFDDVVKAIDNLKKSGARYLMMTDRPTRYNDQPLAVRMPYIEKMSLKVKDDSIILIDLEML